MAEQNIFGQLHDILAEMQGQAAASGDPRSIATARQSRREAAVQNLIEHGATEGERRAAQAAMHRMKHDALDREAEEYWPEL